jgi:hypothetical protein
MPGTSTRGDATRGWVVEIVGHRVGEAARTGEIVEVLGPPDSQPHYRVRWADGHESLVYPGSDVVLRPPPKPSAKAKKEGRPATRARR